MNLRYNAHRKSTNHASIFTEGKRVLVLEANAIGKLASLLSDTFVQAVNKILTCKGKLIFTGMGKAGIIAQKISGTFSSLGHPSFFMHPGEAGHGDLGMVAKNDLVFLLSNSGNTSEVSTIVPFIKEIGSLTVAITGNRESYLYKNVDIPLWIGAEEEACGLGLAPTTSTTLMLALGDALAVSVLKQDRHFNERRFAFNHPGGVLGKKLTRVNTVMRAQDNIVAVPPKTPVAEVLVAMTNARIGSAVVVSPNKTVQGIFSDGDLRRSLEQGGVLGVLPKSKKSSGKNLNTEFLSRAIKEVMTAKPLTLSATSYVMDALEVMSRKKIGEIPVVGKSRKLVGVLCLKDLV